MKERVNFTIDHSTGKPVYCAKMVSFPIIIQANSAEELSSKSRTILEIYIKHINIMLLQDEPFEYRYMEMDEYIKNMKKP
jgi:hypothetical protein